MDHLLLLPAPQFKRRWVTCLPGQKHAEELLTTDRVGVRFAFLTISELIQAASYIAADKTCSGTLSQ